MEKIIKGIRAFQEIYYRERSELFARLAAGQNPETLFITCSDSRIDPNLITQTDPGDLFVLRNAGNIVPPHLAVGSGEAATIEFAVTALGVRDIVVCGHSDCGAMKGLLALEQLDSMPSVSAWLAHAAATRQVVTAKYRDDSARDRLDHTIKENILVQLNNLRTHPSVAAALAAGRLELHGWIYCIETGDVYAYDHQRDDFVAIGTRSESS
jgi:carbonic anhydrase